MELSANICHVYDKRLENTFDFHYKYWRLTSLSRRERRAKRNIITRVTMLSCEYSKSHLAFGADENDIVILS